MVLGVPRGGVPVAFEIAAQLHAPLDVIMAKKIGHPMHEEYAIGAVTEDEVLLDDVPLISATYIEQKTAALKALLHHRARLLRGSRPPLEVQGRNVIVADDGVATGHTLIACIRALRRKSPAQIIVAVPVAPRHTADELRAVCDELVCLEESDNFRAVGAFYKDFTQVSDEEAFELLKSAAYGPKPGDPQAL